MDTGSWKSLSTDQSISRPKVHTSLLHGFSPTQVSAQPARGFSYGLGCSAVKWLELLASGGHNYPSKLTPIEMNGSTPFSAGVIVAVCLAVDSKGESLPWFATRKAGKRLSLTLGLFFKIGKVLQICGVGTMGNGEAI